MTIKTATVVISNPTQPISLGMSLLGGVVDGASIGDLQAQRDMLLTALESLVLFTNPSKTNAVALHAAHCAIAAAQGGEA